MIKFIYKKINLRPIPAPKNDRRLKADMKIDVLIITHYNAVAIEEIEVVQKCRNIGSQLDIKRPNFNIESGRFNQPAKFLFAIC